MSGKTSYLANQMLRSLRGLTPAAFTETWVTLFTTAPTADTTAGVAAAVEWSPTSPRSRVYSDGATEPFWWLAPLDTDEGAQTFNYGPIQWSGVAGLSAAATVVAVGIYSASSGGSLLYWQDLGHDRVVSNGDSVLFLQGSLKVTEQ